VESEFSSRADCVCSHKVAEFLHRYTEGKRGLLFCAASKTPHMYSNLEDRWELQRKLKRERGNELVDVAGIEPATPCLQSEQGKR
jgi:hypothetical protein